MANKNDIFKQVIKYKGYFNFADLYAFCFDWLSDAGFKTAEGSYSEKVSGGGKDIEFEWSSSKKVTDYVKFQLDIDWSVSGLKEAEVERDGKTETTNKGSIKITVKATFISDYSDEWEKKPHLKLMRGIYDKYIVRTTLDQYQGKLAGAASELVKNIKSYLQLEV